MNMKRIWIMILTACLAAACGPSRTGAHKTVENGVEIVSNPAIPYRPGQAGPFALDEEFRIDSETEARIGDILGFEANAAGEVFVLSRNIGSGDCIFKYDSTGRFIGSFGRKGQGPGELRSPHHIAPGPNGGIVISDTHRLIQYDVGGGFLRELPLDFAARVTAGPSGTWLSLDVGQEFRGEKQTMTWSVQLLDSGYGNPRRLDSLSAEISAEKLPFPEPLLCWTASNDNIFVANEDRAFDIHVYDEAGVLKRRIKKEFSLVPVSDEFKARTLKPLPEPMRKAVQFPESHTPFQSLAAADDGTLFVATFEKGDRPGEYIFDIFGPDGVLKGRKTLPAVVWEGHLWISAKAGRFYGLSEKSNGFKEIIVSRILWK
jgi:hypothetical protein